jgi:hypothetical protein
VTSSAVVVEHSFQAGMMQSPSKGEGHCRLARAGLQVLRDVADNEAQDVGMNRPIGWRAVAPSLERRVLQNQVL